MSAIFHNFYKNMAYSVNPVPFEPLYKEFQRQMPSTFQNLVNSSYGGGNPQSQCNKQNGPYATQTFDLQTQPSNYQRYNPNQIQLWG